MFQWLKKMGVIDGDVTIAKWKEKDLSTCIISGDPECAFQKGTVGCARSVVGEGIDSILGERPACFLPMWPRALLHARWEQKGFGASQKKC